MPQKINMNLNTNNYSSIQYTQYMESLNHLQKVAQPKQTSLKTAMIGRIHNVRPGCGSCGKK